MGLWGKIFSAGSGAVSSVAHHATGLADPRKVLRNIDPRSLMKRADPRTIAKSVSSGRLPGASTLPGASSLMPGFGLNLKDRLRLKNGHPEAIAKAMLSAAEGSSSSRWAPQGFGKGMGAQVSNIASMARSGVSMSAVSKIARKTWF